MRKLSKILLTPTLILLVITAMAILVSTPTSVDSPSTEEASIDKPVADMPTLPSVAQSSDDTASSGQTSQAPETETSIEYKNPEIDMASTETIHVEGKLRLAYAEYESNAEIDHPSSEKYYILSNDNGSMALTIPKDLEGRLAPQSTFSGEITNDEIRTVASANITLPVPNIAPTPTKKSHRIFIAVFNDASTPTGTTNAGGNQVINVARATNIVNLVKDYWVENTNGYITNFTIADTRIDANPANSGTTGICSRNAFSDDFADEAARKFGYSDYADFAFRQGNTNNPAHLLVFLPRSCSYVPYAGYAPVGASLHNDDTYGSYWFGGAQWVYIVNSLSSIDTGYNYQYPPILDQKGSYNIETLAHELGHNFGLSHAGTVSQDKTSIPYVEYDDLYSIMGGGYVTYELPKLDAYYKDWLKIPNNQVLSTSLGGANHIATKLKLNATGSASGDTGIKIVDQITGKSYYVEFRNGLISSESKTQYGYSATYPAVIPRNDLSLALGGSGNLCFLPGIRITTDADEMLDQIDPRYYPNPLLATIALTTQVPYKGGSCYPANHPIDQWFTVANSFQLKFYPVSDNQISVAIKPLNFPFNDVGSDNSFKGDIFWAYQNGIAAGQQNYMLYDNVSRGQMAAFMYRLQAKPDRSDFTSQDTAKFSDSQPQHTAFHAEIAWMGKTGLSMPGCTSNCPYSPNDSVTRGQMAAFMYRLAGSPSLDGLTPSDYAKFVDSTSEKTVFYREIAWMGKTGLSMPGCYAGCYYSPNDPVNRAQMAAFMRRLNDSFLHIEYY
jgi:hypothetical protein